MAVSAIPSLAFAQTAACPFDMSTRALDGTDDLKTWKQVEDYRARYHACDDGAIAEGVSDAVVRLLAHRWTTLPALKAEVSQDANLLPFVLRHIDATTDDRNIAAIARQSKSACPAGSKPLCRQLGRAAADTLKEMNGAGG